MVTPHRASRTIRPARAIVLVDAMVAAVLLAVALTALLQLTDGALSAAAEGRRLRDAAMLLDEQLQLVLMRGADDYAARFDTEGLCDPPFEQYRYRIDVTPGQAGQPHRVRATIRWSQQGRLRSVSVETLIAPRRGEDVDPERRPAVPVERLP